jgi:DNA-binding transcriptional regulator YiaG
MKHIRCGMRRKTTLAPQRSAGPLAPEDLKQWRRSLQLTQQEAANQLAVTLKAYQNWEQGVRKAHQHGSLRKLMAQAASRSRKVS